MKLRAPGHADESSMPINDPARAPLQSFVVVAMIAVLALGACSRDTRPGADDWQATWLRTVAAVPDPSVLGDPPDRRLCGDALAELRAIQPDLFPTPDLALDETVSQWVSIAEDAMFECPPASAGIPSLAAAYAELARLEAEVAAVLAIDIPRP